MGLKGNSLLTKSVQMLRRVNALGLGPGAGKTRRKKTIPARFRDYSAATPSPTGQVTPVPLSPQ